MAGGHGHGGFQPVKIDPAIERWNIMRENVYKTFKFTPKTATQVLVWGAIVPATVGLALYYQDATHDWSGKKRGESLMKTTSSAPASAVADQ